MIDFKKIVFASFISIGMYDVITGFLFDRECVAPPPCICYSSTIRCQRQNLTEMPMFTEHNEHYISIYVWLNNNELSTIPANAFKNLSSINATRVQIFLYNNSLYDINSHAFDGIATAVNTLNLKFNNLTYLPSALATLTSLRNLYLDGNPLTSLDSAVMSQLGQTVQVFTISVDQFAVFPSELHLLGKMWSLVMTVGYNNTSLSQIYSVIAGIPKLSYLDITGNTFDCTCSGMDSLKPWNVTSLRLAATCHSGEDVKTYLTSYLPKCP